MSGYKYSKTEEEFHKKNIKIRGKCDFRDCCMFVGVLHVSSATVYKVYNFLIRKVSGDWREWL